MAQSSKHLKASPLAASGNVSVNDSASGAMGESLTKTQQVSQIGSRELLPALGVDQKNSTLVSLTTPTSNVGFGLEGSVATESPDKVREREEETRQQSLFDQGLDTLILLHKLQTEHLEQADRLPGNSSLF